MMTANVCFVDQARRVSCTEMEVSHSSEPEHMLLLERNEDSDRHFSPPETLTHCDSNTGTHCHYPAEPEDRVARNQLIAISVLCFVFMVTEIVGGLLAGSLAVATDATHMASDLAGFLISLVAIWLSRKPATHRLSFGFYRAEVIGALTSVLIIWIVTAVLVGLAIQRVRNPGYEIHGATMVITASVAVAFNVAMGAVLHLRVCKGCLVSHGHSHLHSCGSGEHLHSAGTEHGGLSDDVILAAPMNGCQPSLIDGDDRLLMSNDDDDSRRSMEFTLQHSSPVPSTNVNIRAAMVHVIGDLIQSFGVLTAAIIVLIEPDYKIADPICTFIFSFLVLCTTLTVLRDILLIIMEGVPRNINYREMKRDLRRLPGVEAVHSLNVWSLTMDKVVVTVHLAVGHEVRWSDILDSGTEILRHKYRVHQTTIQIERYDSSVMTSCRQCRLP